MACVCLGNPVQIPTCPIRLLHVSETSANALLAFMTSWAEKSMISYGSSYFSLIHKQGNVPIYEFLSPLHFWLITKSLPL